MSATVRRDCPELPATLLWLYGEGDASAPSHAATCPVCAAAVAEAESVLAALPPGVPRALGSAQGASAGRLAEVIALPRPGASDLAASDGLPQGVALRTGLGRPIGGTSRWRRTALALGAVAVAAGLLLSALVAIPRASGPDVRGAQSTGHEQHSEDPLILRADEPVVSREIEMSIDADITLDLLYQDLEALEASFASL